MMSGSSATPCNNDSDCGNEYHCLSDICEECIPCSVIFNRQPPSNNETICAKTEKDCGNCLPGYLADELTNERNFSTKCYAPEKLDSSDPPATEFKLKLAVFIASASVAFVAVIALFTFYKKIRRWKSHSPTVDDVEMMEVGKRPQPSAPHPDFNVEEPTESNEEMRRLLTTNPMSTFQVDRPCGASPIGPHHEYHPPVDDATIHDEIRNTNAAPAMEMPPRLFLQNNSGYNTVRPLVLRSVSDSGHSHIRLSDYRPTIIRSINSPDRECGIPSTVQNHSQLQPTENFLEVGAALTIKRK